MLAFLPPEITAAGTTILPRRFKLYHYPLSPADDFLLLFAYNMSRYGKQLPKFDKSNLTQMTVCRANFTRKEGVNVFGVKLSPSDVEHGKHVGYLLADGCHFEWGGGEQVSNRYVEVYYRLPMPVLVPAHPHTSPQPQPQPHQGQCGTPGQPLCSAACAPQQIFCGTLAQPDNYPGATLTCAAGHKGRCIPFSCSENSYTRPYPICD